MTSHLYAGSFNTIMDKINPEEIVIRTTLKPGDLGYVIYLHGKLYQQEYGYSTSFEVYVAQGLSEFYRNYDPLLDGIWIMEHKEKIVGFLLLMHRDQGQAQLRYFIIEPAYRGLGLGKMLSDLFMAHFIEKGYERAYLWTTDELYTAANIYQKMGFRLSEEVLSESFGKRVKEQRFDLVLKSGQESSQQV
ncbi:GNAT family N-acetyltransferase [Flavitalea sp.]|nr:GNAT family N-acetyltransferase [Flavitalea sp.]